MISITYDKSVDAAYIALKGTFPPVYLTVAFDDIVKKSFWKKCPFYTLDFDKDGILLGIEILDASKHLPKELLEYTLKIQEMRQQPKDYLAPGC